MCAIFAEADAMHREALPHIFREAAGPARPKDFILKAYTDKKATLFFMNIPTLAKGSHPEYNEG